MKVPFSIVMSATLSLGSLVVASAVSMALAIHWPVAVLCLSTTLLFAIVWPASIMTMFGETLDDRAMSVDEVSLELKGAAPKALLHAIYRVCVALLFGSFAIVVINMLTCYGGRRNCGFLEVAMKVGNVRGIDGPEFGPPLLACSVSGLIASLGLAALMRHKARRLMWLCLVGGSGFCVIAVWIGIRAYAVER